MPLREVVADVLTWPWFSKHHGYNFNGHLIRLPDGNLCVDPVEADEEVLAALAAEGVARIAITNRNHTRAANRVRARTGAPVLLHPADAPHAREQGAIVDGELRVGESLGALTIVGVPGKSAGEVALYWPQRRLLLVGDAVIGNPPGECSLLPPQVMDAPVQLRDSVRSLLDLDVDILLVGDGVSILSGAQARLRALIATFPSG